MSSTGGPIDSMDGSLPSLDELASWATEFRTAGMPGLAADPELLARGAWEGLLTRSDRGDDWDVVSAEADRQSRREGYLDESLTHYLLEVARRADPAAQWELSPEKKRRVPTIDLHDTGISAAAGWSRVSFQWTWFWADRQKKGLLCSEFFALRLRFADSPALAERTQTVLASLLDAPPLAPLIPPRFQVPSNLSGGPGAARFYALGEASQDSVRNALVVAGFRKDGEDILEKHMVGGARFLHLEGVFEAVMIAEGSRLVAIAMLPWGSMPWMHLAAEVALLRAGGQLMPIAETPSLLSAVGIDLDVRESPNPDKDPESEPRDMAFAYPIPRRHIDNQEKWKPLPVVALLAGLADLGLVGGDGELTADHLVDGAELAREDDVITATVAAPGGKPRAVWFEVHNITQGEWDEFHARMTALARSTRARFCTEDELFGHE